MSASRIAHVLSGAPIAGGGFICRCPVPTHGAGRGDRNPSLSVKDGHSHLVVTCFAGCDRREVLAELCRRGLLDEAPGHSRHPEKPIIHTSRSRSRSDGEYERRQREKAAWLWSRSRPIEGTPAERYLRERRGYSGPIPKTLAFLPPRKSEHRPAMIAAYSLVDEPAPGVLGRPCNVTAVHLTLLQTDGSGKADLEPNKLTVGRPRGRPIVLAPPSDLLGLVIAEGIEDALTAHVATGLGAWAAGSASYMPALANAVPSYVETVTILAHADHAGQNGARRLADALVARPIEVFVEGLAP
jgi:Toprim domain-containing protein